MARHHYQSPTPPAKPSDSAGLHGPYGAFRNNGPLRSIIVTLLIIEAMLALFVIILNQAIDPTAVSLAGDKLRGILDITGWAQISARILIVPLFCLWLDRTCKNGWLLDAPKMKTTPGLAVGYLFIPLIFLWKPLTTIKEIRNASYGRHDALKTTLPLWWFFLLAICIITITSSLLHQDGHSPETLLIAQKLTTVSVPLTIILDYLAITLVIGITLAQHRRVSLWRTS